MDHVNNVGTNELLCLTVELFDFLLETIGVPRTQQSSAEKSVIKIKIILIIKY